ncbi:hypothetical protein SESBI_23886 [Sesbania bispinosa]|nr:hypothetical protein SESBI_23886 [Sesbania bispinosa]
MGGKINGGMELASVTNQSLLMAVFITVPIVPHMLLELPQDCVYLLGKTCKESVAESRALKAGEHPPEFMALVGKELLFKVEKTVKYTFNYDDSFKVKRVCDDKEIIKQFKKEKSVETPLKSKFQPPFPDLDGEENVENPERVTPDGIDDSGDADGSSVGFTDASSNTNL